MRTLTLLALGIAACVAVAPAQAQNYFDASDMNISTGPGGTISANFGRSGIVAGTFQDIYQFVLPTDGLASGTISTSAVTLNSIGDLDLLSVYFNGTLLTGLTGGLNEVVFANSVPIVAGATNEIIINGYARGNGSYGGQGVFAPNAVPEPAAWGMMIGGFGLAGMAMRRRKTKVSVRYA